MKLLTKFDSLYNQVHGKALLSVDLPNIYSGEKIGLEYLYEQSGMTLGTGDLDIQVDELDDDSGLEEDSVQVLEGNLMDSSLQGAEPLVTAAQHCKTIYRSCIVSVGYDDMQNASTTAFSMPLVSNQCIFHLRNIK